MKTNEKPTCVLTGTDGNIFAVMGTAKRSLKDAGFSDEAKEMCERVWTCGSYDEALTIVGEYVEIE